MTDSMIDPMEVVIKAALKNQDRLNCTLHTDWARKGWKYYRAIWTECGEAMNHGNWMWWKTSRFGLSPDATQMANIHLELVDILHFGLSLTMISDGLRDEQLTKSAQLIVDHWKDSEGGRFTEMQDGTFVALESVAAAAIRNKFMDYNAFFQAVRSTALTFEQLMGLYFAKTALNNFRWARGYARGEYVKMWRYGAGKVEDNQYLHGYALRVLAESNHTGPALYGFILSQEFNDALVRNLTNGYAEFAVP